MKVFELVAMLMKQPAGAEVVMQTEKPYTDMSGCEEMITCYYPIDSLSISDSGNIVLQAPPEED